MGIIIFITIKEHKFCDYIIQYVVSSYYNLYIQNEFEYIFIVLLRFVHKKWWYKLKYFWMVIWYTFGVLLPKVNLIINSNFIYVSYIVCEPFLPETFSFYWHDVFYYFFDYYRAPSKDSVHTFSSLKTTHLIRKVNELDLQLKFELFGILLKNRHSHLIKLHFHEEKFPWQNSNSRPTECHQAALQYKKK